MVPDLELTPLFTGIDDEYLALLRPLFERVSYHSGETVIKQGEAADFIYLVENGTVAITYKPYDDEPITITHVEVGGLFGWSALMGSRNYTSSGIATEDLDVIRLGGSNLRKLCVEHPDAGKVILDRLASAVSSRWKDAHAQVKAILEGGINS